METKDKSNRQYKDSVFTLLFRSIAYSLYCAVTGKPYDPNAKVEDATLPGVFFRDRLNDLAFVLEDRLVVLIEHQSSINANMPLRMLSYIARVYEWYIEWRYGKGAVYEKRVLRIPRPEFIVLYNGKEKMPGDGNHHTMRLSDMFAAEVLDSEPLLGGLDLTVEMFNINKGHNPDMAARCPELDDYETFVQMVRENEAAGLRRDEAVRKAVDDCIEKNILSEFLKQYSWEVIGMLMTEWNIEDEIAVVSASAREEGREEGMGYGIAEATKRFARALLDDGKDMAYVARMTGLDQNDVLKLMGVMK